MKGNAVVITRSNKKTSFINTFPPSHGNFSKSFSTLAQLCREKQTQQNKYNNNYMSFFNWVWSRVPRLFFFFFFFFDNIGTTVYFFFFWLHFNENKKLNRWFLSQKETNFLLKKTFKSLCHFKSIQTQLSKEKLARKWTKYTINGTQMHFIFSHFLANLVSTFLSRSI